MTTDSSKLPPLSALRVFEAAARRGNFTHAGHELALSQAAVSQQVRRLEQDLGVALFERKHRSVALTPAGTRMFRAVRVGLDMIANTAREIRKGQAPTSLRVAADLAFAHHWLMPRIVDFCCDHPHIAPSIVASDYEADCLRDDIDVAILYGGGQWPHYSVRFILDEEVFPVCSPAYLESQGPMAVETLDRHVLLDLQGRWDWMSWRQWLPEAGVPFSEHTRLREFNNWPVLTEAAINSQGIALGWKYLSDTLLRNGTLVRPLPDSVVTERGYYLVTKEALSAHAAEFCTWLTQRTTALRTGSAA